jgi:integrase/recombinase XerD
LITNRPVAANKGRKFPAETLTPEEVNILIGRCSSSSVTGIRNRAMLTFLYRSGLRVSELLAIRPSDVTLASHSIRLLDTKIGQAQTRGFHPAADDALMRWLDKRRELGFRGGPLFCVLSGEHKGRPVSSQYVRGLLKRLAAEARIDKRVHPHGLRHTYAIELEAARTPIATISKLLGHRSVATTMRYLDHLSNGQAIEALQSIELPPLDDSKAKGAA